MCGFTHSTCVSVPVRVNFFDMSKIDDGEWCADADAAAKSIASKTNSPEVRYLNGLPPSILAECITKASVAAFANFAHFLESPDGPTFGKIPCNLLPSRRYSCT